MKIPRYDSQVGTATPPQFTQIMDVRSDNGLSAIADGLEQIYKIKLQEQEEAKKTAIFQSDTSIKMALDRAAFDVMEKIKNGGSYANAEAEYQKAHDAAIAQFGKGFDVDESGNTRMRAMSEYQAIGLDKILRIRDAVTSRRRSDTVASADNMVDLLKKDYSLATDDKVKREEIAAKMSSTIAGLTATGVITPDEGKQKLRSFLESAEEDRLKLLATETDSPELLLAEVEASKRNVGVDFFVQAKSNSMAALEEKEKAQKVNYALSGISGVPDFKAAVTSVFKEEGMGYVDNDGGKGPTIYGVNSEANREEFNQIMKLRSEGKTSEAIALAEQVYKTKYWDAIGADKLAPDLAHVAMDTAVNMGQGVAKKLIAESGGDLYRFNELRKEEYKKIAEANPAKQKYLNGWLARADRVTASVANGDYEPKQKDVDAFYNTTLSQIQDEDQFNDGVIKVAKATGFIPTAVQKQIKNSFSYYKEGMSDSDIATVARNARLVSNLAREASSEIATEGNNINKTDVMTADIISSRIDSGLTERDAVETVLKTKNDPTAKEVYEKARDNVLKTSGDGYTYSDFAEDVADAIDIDEKNFSAIKTQAADMFAYAKSNLGASDDEASSLAVKAISKTYGSFDGYPVKYPPQMVSNIRNEQLWVETAQKEFNNFYDTEYAGVIPNGMTATQFFGRPILMGDTQTKAEIDSGKPISFVLAYRNEFGGIVQVHKKDGQRYRVSAEPEMDGKIIRQEKTLGISHTPVKYWFGGNSKDEVEQIKAGIELQKKVKRGELR